MQCDTTFAVISQAAQQWVMRYRLKESVHILPALQHSHLVYFCETQQRVVSNY
jgi:hypothetical protein